MPKLFTTLLPAAIVAALFAFSGSAALAADCGAAADTPVDQLAQADAEAAVLCLTNNERDANGLAALSSSDVLAGAARGHADDAAAIKWWVDGADPHTNPQTGSQPADRIFAAGYCPNPQSWRVAENTFWAYQTGDGASAPSPRDAVSWWMGSPGHRANILDPGLTELGVGVVPDTAAPVDGDQIAAGSFVEDFGSCVNRRADARPHDTGHRSSNHRAAAEHATTAYKPPVVQAISQAQHIRKETKRATSVHRSHTPRPRCGSRVLVHYRARRGGGARAVHRSTGAACLFAWTPQLDIDPALAQGSVFFGGRTREHDRQVPPYRNGLTDS